jgi:hypothetical protein
MRRQEKKLTVEGEVLHVRRRMVKIFECVEDAGNYDGVFR